MLFYPLNFFGTGRFLISPDQIIEHTGWRWGTWAMAQLFSFLRGYIRVCHQRPLCDCEPFPRGRRASDQPKRVLPADMHKRDMRTITIEPSSGPQQQMQTQFSTEGMIYAQTDQNHNQANAAARLMSLTGLLVFAAGCGMVTVRHVPKLGAISFPGRASAQSHPGASL